MTRLVSAFSFVCAAVVSIGSLASAQQAAVPRRIGYVSGTGTPAHPGPYFQAFQQRLRQLGYSEGKNVALEYRGAEGKIETIPAVVKDLIERNVDVLVLPLIAGLRAAQRLTKTIPIVMVTQVDPVATGLVESLARPGGNITGIATLQRDLSGKRLELLSEVVPNLSRVGILREGNETVAQMGFKDYESAARMLKIHVQSLQVYGSDPNIRQAFETAVKAQLHAIITITNNPLFRNAKHIADLAIAHRLPSVFEGSSWVERGGLLSYSANDLELFGRAAVYVDKILRGAKPADLPVEQPKKFELVINVKTAKQIGVVIPPNVLARADRVIR